MTTVVPFVFGVGAAFSTHVNAQATEGGHWEFGTKGLQGHGAARRKWRGLLKYAARAVESDRAAVPRGYPSWISSS